MENVKRNIDYAQEAKAYTIQALPYGAANVKGRSKETGIRLAAMRKECYEKYGLLFDKYFYRKIADIAESRGVGNCGEHAAVAFKHLTKNHPQLRIEQIADIANDHVFVVIDRNPNSEINNPKTWGDTAIICDAWARKCFPAKDLDNELEKILTEHLYPPKPPKSLKEKELRVLASSDDFLWEEYIWNLFKRFIPSDQNLWKLFERLTLPDQNLIGVPTLSLLGA